MVRTPLTPAEIAAGRRVGEALRAARCGRRLADVAAAAAISPETLRKIETGRLPSPAFGTIVQLCRALDLDISDVASTWMHAVCEPAGQTWIQALREYRDPIL